MRVLIQGAAILAIMLMLGAVGLLGGCAEHELDSVALTAADCEKGGCYR